MTALTEKKTKVNGRAESPNQHDVLTGSMPDGTASTASGDTTCSNWSSGDKGSALVGHHDRWGLNDSAAAISWNSSHRRNGAVTPTSDGAAAARGLLPTWPASVAAPLAIRDVRELPDSTLGIDRERRRCRREPGCELAHERQSTTSGMAWSRLVPIGSPHASHRP